jgi:ankyrin repeat protein
MVEFLLTNKADVNARNDNGDTPLHLAAEFGRKEVVEFLLTNKADVNARDNNGETPLQLTTDRIHGIAILAAEDPARDAGFESMLQRLQEVANLLRQHGDHE